ncbi:tetratricopeptide repeat protein [Alteromonas ponticola]|uniref:Tetratricopeptide repeat protein n=2 Tax=Alteromonas aquimaris TaxID=2998417 RepID=A0ABT3P3K7_9ALTE|nr:tetratricopeptide repeat protein [Alteromonas aquimaris]
MYIIDGQRYFLHAVAHQQSLRFQDKTPEMIVIGITTDNKKRRQWLYPQRETFMAFLAQELVPWVDKNYRTSEERLYFGWEMAGGLVPDLVSSHPALFQAIFMASPSHINHQRIERIEQYLQKPTHQHFIYATLAEVETWSTAGMSDLQQAVTSAKNASVNLQYHLLAHQDHYTTPLLTIDNGLLSYYSDYGPLRFYSLQEFEDFGGLPALQKHYAKRGKRYGVSKNIHDDTKHYLLNQALKENNLPLFQILEESFDGFVEHYYKREFWFERIANAYLALGESEKAIEVLQAGIRKLPDAHSLYAALGKLHSQSANTERAVENYKKAIELTTADIKLQQTYQNELSRLAREK